MTGTVHLAIIGAGGVGRSFLKQLAFLSQSPSTPKNLSIHLITRSSKILFNEANVAIASQDWSAALDASTTKPPPLDELVAQLAKQAPRPLVLVDNTSSEEWASKYPELVRAGVSIVTPNKKGFSSNLELWDGIFGAAANGSGGENGGFVFHESTVGAGLPVLSTLRELVDTGDKVTRIEGVFSGTMSYLFNSWNPVGDEEGGLFSAAVRTARDLGYTEPDPRDDLNGLDVARKLTILARIAGLKVAGPTSFPVQSLVPKELEGVKSADEFLDGLVKFDTEIGGVKEEAKKEGKVVRFVGSVDVVKGDVKVGLEKFDKSHPIAALKGSDNIISLYTERYGANPLIIQGAGAGAAVTAMGTSGDLLNVLRLLK